MYVSASPLDTACRWGHLGDPLPPPCPLRLRHGVSHNVAIGLDTPQPVVLRGRARRRWPVGVEAKSKQEEIFFDSRTTEGILRFKGIVKFAKKQNASEK